MTDQIFNCVADRSAEMTGNNAGFAGYTARLFIAGARVLKSGRGVRVTICAGADGLAVSDAFVGHSVSGSPFDGGQVRLTFGGGSSFSLPPGGSVTSDMVPFNCIAGKRLGIDLFASGPGSFARSGVPSDYALYFKAGNVAGQTAPSGFTTGSTDLTMVGHIDVLADVISTPTVSDNGPLAVIARPTVTFDCLAGTVPVIPPHTPPYLWTSTVGGHQRQQPRLSQIGGVIACFGDSGVEAVCPSSDWSPYCVSFAVNGSTITDLLNSLPLYTCLHNARGTILQIGINDLISGSGALSDPAIVAELAMRVFNWLTGPLVWIPINHTATQAQHSTIDAFNSIVSAALAGRPNYAKADLNPLICDANGIVLPGMLQDNEHLAAPAQALLAPLVRAAIRTSGML